MQGPQELQVAAPWFEALRSGAKTVEGRLAKGRFAALRPGAVLVVSRAGASPRAAKLVLVVTRAVRYAGFEEYLSQEGLARALPGVRTIAEGVRVYRQFYTEDAERAHGVVALHVARA